MLMKKQSMSRQGGAKTRFSYVYLRVQVDMPICMWGVSKCTHIRIGEKNEQID